jgi:hypothetical protein
MGTPTLFCNEIKEGKVDAVKEFVQHCIQDKNSEYQEMLKRYDLNDTRFWIQNMHGKSYLLFTHNMGSEGYSRLAGWNDSTHEFDQWFNNNLKEIFANDHENQQPEFLDFIKVD